MIGSLYGSLMGISRGHDLAQQQHGLNEKLLGSMGGNGVSAQGGARDEVNLAQTKIQSQANRAMQDSSNKMLAEEFQRRRNSVFA